MESLPRAATNLQLHGCRYIIFGTGPARPSLRFDREDGLFNDRKICIMSSKIQWAYFKMTENVYYV
jgi:hypothetical protein